MEAITHQVVEQHVPRQTRRYIENDRLENQDHSRVLDYLVFTGKQTIMSKQSCQWLYQHTTSPIFILIELRDSVPSIACGYRFPASRSQRRWLVSLLDAAMTS